MNATEARTITVANLPGPPVQAWLDNIHVKIAAAAARGARCLLDTRTRGHTPASTAAPSETARPTTKSECAARAGATTAAAPLGQAAGVRVMNVQSATHCATLSTSSGPARSTSFTPVLLM
jgi:hypothetical protein